MEQLSLPDEGCHFRDGALAGRSLLRLLKARGAAGRRCRGSGPLSSRAHSPALPPSPPRPPTAADCNSIEFKSLAAWSGQAAGPEALSNQGFYSYFNPREVPAFLCLTKTSENVQRLVRYKVLRRTLSQRLWGTNESQSTRIVHCAGPPSILNSQGRVSRSDTVNKWREKVYARTHRFVQQACSGHAADL